MNYIAVIGKGNPNETDGEYKQAVGLLYAIAYKIPRKASPEKLKTVIRHPIKKAD